MLLKFNYIHSFILFNIASDTPLVSEHAVYYSYKCEFKRGPLPTGEG